MDKFRKDKNGKIANRSVLQDDFNTSFWNIIGVNNKVFQFIDIFPSISKNKNSSVRYRNTRDKVSDEKSYERFLNGKLRDDTKYFNFKVSNILLFITLLKSTIRNTQDYNFYSKQFFNLILNYHHFSKPPLLTEKMISLFAFQLAYTIEYMKQYKLDTELFEQSIQNNSIEPFLNECKKQTKCKTDSNLATYMSYNHEELKKTMLQSAIYIETITPSTFKKYISYWKNRKSLPSILHMFTISIILHKNDSRQTEGKLFQLIIIRALLFIENKYDISDQIKEEFIEKLRLFRKRINYLYKNDATKIINLQTQHLEDCSIILDMNSDELYEIVND